MQRELAASGGIALRVVALLLALSAQTTLAQRTAPTYSPDARAEQMDQQIRQSIARVAAARHVLIDPAVRDAIVETSHAFSGNFCVSHAPGQADMCRLTIGTLSVLDPVVDAVLSDMLRRPAQMTSLAARLATAAGSDLGAAGWGTTIDNEAGVVAIPSGYAGQKIGLQTATGTISLGIAGRAILVRPGRYAFSFTAGDGTSSTSTVSVQPLARVALAGVATSSMASVAPVAAGRIGIPDYLCPDQAAVTYNGLYAFFNWGRGAYAEAAAVKAANLMPFVRQAGLEVKIRYQDASQCTADCVLGLGIAFARAIALWRSACDRCGGNSFVTIKVGRHLWIDERAAGQLRKAAAAGSADLNLSHVSITEMQTLNRSFSQFSPSATRVGYEELDGDTVLLGQLCQTADDAAPWVADAKGFACPGGTPRVDGLHPSIFLRSAGTSCGDPADFLACGNPGGQVELSLALARFRLRTPGGPTYVGVRGGPLFDGQAIIIHEVAHWFGVPHAESARLDAVKDIMGEHFDPAKSCVSYASLIMLNNAADRRWAFRAKGSQGLRWPVQ